MTDSSKKRLITPNLAWFMFIMIIANTGSMMSLPLISVYLRERFGASLTEIGSVYTLAYILPLFLQIYGGWLSDSIGRLRTIAIGAFVATMGYIGFIFAPNWQWIMIALMLEYVSGSMVGPSYSAYIADQTLEENRAKVFGFTTSLYTLVGIIGPPVGGYLVDQYSFKVMLSVSAVTYGIAAVMRIWMATSVRFKEKSSDEVKELMTWSVFKQNLVKTFSLIAAGGILTWIFITDGVRDIGDTLSDELIPVYYTDVAGMTKTQIGEMRSINWIALMIFTSVGGWVADKYSERMSITSGLSIIFTGYLVLLHSTGFLGFAVSRALFGMGGGLIWPAYDSLISKVVPENIRGTVFGILGTSLGLISLPAPFVGGILWDSFSPKAPIWGTAGLYLIGIFLVWFKFKLPDGETIKGFEETKTTAG